MKSPSKIFIGVFGGIGLLMLLGAAATLSSTWHFHTRAAQAQGTVTELATRRGSKGSVTYAPVYTFTDAAGTTHQVTSRSSSRPAAYAVGEAVTVYYAPGDPQAARLSGFMENWFLPLLFSLFATVFGGIGVGILVYEIRRRRWRAHMCRFGRRTPCTVSSIGHNTSVRINGRHPWYINLHWRDPFSGEEREFRSEDLYVDPARWLGQRIDVLIDPQDSASYWVDVTPLEATR